ncbi:DNA repair protein RecO [Wenyingzhuangia sp. 2_MG-2023]|uniref:DNA repair protein RecO n=1 Tax=Wenyingzhuangia sp. 2_MG-2023 TaxID=3062639 RepID=UPI0026E29D39|nr:DNA repair protein RecO [Wenyingzhuangia sp. 2_MG-2023]MDO6736565.1 DNA repair protein RecO [Wenyingzhuangia sp. 2_MG-2023]MDO6801140.1 DNA repair protein RecO [Wenyingzhuangia sp. 1_MG-2023]
MQVTTKAIVINSVKYGDHGLIVKCYTEEEGVKSYILRGVLKQKKGKINKSQFLPLTILQINASHNNKGSLNSILEAKVIHLFHTLHTHFLKQSIVFFLSEFLTSVLREEEGENQVLFEFLESAILWLDHHDQVANFHLKFLIELTKCLGFYPDETGMEKGYFFDLSEGKYVLRQGANILQGDNLALFNKALGIKFDVLDQTLFHKNQRGVVLDLLLKYYQLHLPSFRRPKSIDILSKVLE